MKALGSMKAKACRIEIEGVNKEAPEDVRSAPEDDITQALRAEPTSGIVTDIVTTMTVQSAMPKEMTSVWRESQWDEFRERVDAVLKTSGRILWLEKYPFRIVLGYVAVALLSILPAPYLSSVTPGLHREELLVIVGVLLGTIPVMVAFLILVLVRDLCMPSSMIKSLRTTLEELSGGGVSFHLREEVLRVDQIEEYSKYGTHTVRRRTTAYFIEAQFGGALPITYVLDYTDPAYATKYAAKYAAAAESKAATASSAAAKSGNSQERMGQLDKLLKSGLISKQEYDGKRAQILEMV